MWFANLDTNSPWGTSFPLSVPALAKKEVGVLGSKPITEFVQVNSTQRWTQNIGFGQAQNETPKKTPKIPAAPSPDLSLNDLSGDSSLEDDTAQNLYKTELCRSFEETGTCRYGMKCQFAHGKAELRVLSRHPKYKTEVCKTFHTIGTCPYGKRCRFIHIEAPVPSQSPSVKLPPKVETKAPTKSPVFEKNKITTTNGPSMGIWSNNWTGSYPPTTNVNFNPVVKGLPAQVSAVEQFFSTNTSMELQERRSRLGIFQQICS